MPRARIRRDLFAAAHGLQLRMVVTAVLTPLIVLACLAAIAALLPFKLALGAGGALLFGIGSIIAERARRPAATPLTVAEAPQLHAITERLRALADLPKPEIVLEAERQPNSWIIGLRRGRSRLHVTEGLLELLPPDELEAVVAHELAHVAHRDAAVMTPSAARGRHSPTAVSWGASAVSSRSRRGRSWPRSSACCRRWAPGRWPGTASSRPTRAPSRLRAARRRWRRR